MKLSNSHLLKPINYDSVRIPLRFYVDGENCFTRNFIGLVFGSPFVLERSWMEKEFISSYLRTLKFKNLRNLDVLVLIFMIYMSLGVLEPPRHFALLFNQTKTLVQWLSGLSTLSNRTVPYNVSKRRHFFRLGSPLIFSNLSCIETKITPMSLLLSWSKFVKGKFLIRSFCSHF